MGSHSPESRLIVVKIGSSTLVDEHGVIDRAFVGSLVSQICDILDQGNRVILVSSGAVAAGMERLGFSRRPSDTPTLQACAATGQSILTETYAELFHERGVLSGQVLLTRGDTADRTAYLNARNTLDRLVELGAVPIVNENDTVSTEEFAFGDNDMLGAIVSSLVGADLYVILSDVDGLYTSNPDTDGSATLVRRIEKVTPRVFSMASGPTSAVGTGGMSTKVRAGRAMITAGIPMVVCRGRKPGVLLSVVSGDEEGTLFAGESDQGEGARKLWIGLAGISRGSVKVDRGAMRALEEYGASLLPVGITGVTGTFGAGDVVNVVGPDDELLARGVVRYSSQEIEKVHGLKLDIVARFLPDRADQPCIHRDELLVF